MKYLSILLVVFILFSCKDDNRQKDIEDFQQTEDNKGSIGDSLSVKNSDFNTLDRSISIEIKQKELIEKKDERDELKNLIIDKKYVVNHKDYNINFKYPLLNESLKPTHRNFNDFMNDYYVNVAKTIADIKENKSLCDSITASKFREERFIDYKIYNVNDQHVSVLFYKENFYSGALHPSYTFECFNFDLNKGVFMNYEDFFIQGSEDELLAIINNKINEQIQKGNLYYDCWQIPSYEFFDAKNNFVINDTYIEYYFDDCVMCPSYTGTYSIQLPIVSLLPVLKKSNSNPLVI